MNAKIIMTTSLLIFSTSLFAEGGNQWEKILNERHEIGSPPIITHAKDMGMTAVEHKRYHFDGNDVVRFMNENPTAAGHSETDHREYHTDRPARASDYKREIFGS
jgi:hypothetical protein